MRDTTLQSVKTTKRTRLLNTLVRIRNRSSNRFFGCDAGFGKSIVPRVEIFPILINHRSILESVTILPKPYPLHLHERVLMSRKLSIFREKQLLLLAQFLSRKCQCKTAKKNRTTYTNIDLVSLCRKHDSRITVCSD